MCGPISATVLSHPMNAQLELKGLKTGSKPWALCYVPRAVPDWNFWSGGAHSLSARTHSVV